MYNFSLRMREGALVFNFQETKNMYLKHLLVYENSSRRTPHKLSQKLSTVFVIVFLRNEIHQRIKLVL